MHFVQRGPGEWTTGTLPVSQPLPYSYQPLALHLRKLGSASAPQQTKHSPEPQQQEKTLILLKTFPESIQYRDCYPELAVLGIMSLWAPATRKPVWGCCTHGTEALRPKLLAENPTSGRGDHGGCNFLFGHQTPLSCLCCR